MTQTTLTAANIGNECLCLALRKAARHIARRYDAAFSGLKITSGQFSILAALLQDDPVPMAKLAATLGLDRTTLTRNLRPLLLAGLIEERTNAKDARNRDHALTETGRSLLMQAVPIWQRAQDESGKQLPRTDWPALKHQLFLMS